MGPAADASRLATEIVERFGSGDSVRTIATSTGMTRRRVRQIITDAGELVHPQHAVQLPSDPSWWEDQFHEGWTVADLATRMGTNQMNVYRRLRTLLVSPPREQPIDRWVANRTTQEGDCLRWTKSTAHGRPSGAYAGSGYQSVRRIIWEHSHGPIPEGSWVVPTPGCPHRDCVAITHLRLITPQDHVAERVEARRFRWGENHGRAKLSETDALAILQQRTTNPDHLAARYDVSRSTIYAIWAGRRWAHLTPHTRT